MASVAYVRYAAMVMQPSLWDVVSLPGPQKVAQLMMVNGYGQEYFVPD